MTVITGVDVQDPGLVHDASDMAVIARVDVQDPGIVHDASDIAEFFHTFYT